jgi:soluble lytic murein transglycosylase
LVALSRRRLNKKKARRRVILLLLLLLAIFNFDKILQLIYPIPYQETITFYGEFYNVDPLLIAAVIKTESNFNSKAVSERGAMGLMQIMPDTGAWVAGQMGEANYDHDILFVPETNIKFGTWYIADLAKEFGDNTVLILAAYNGGRGNVAEWLADNKLTTQASDISRIPFPETRNYVGKVLFYYKLYNRLYSQVRHNHANAGLYHSGNRISSPDKYRCHLNIPQSAVLLTTNWRPSC